MFPWTVRATSGHHWSRLMSSHITCFKFLFTLIAIRKLDMIALYDSSSSGVVSGFYLYRTLANMKFSAKKTVLSMK